MHFWPIWVDWFWCADARLGFTPIDMRNIKKNIKTYGNERWFIDLTRFEITAAFAINYAECQEKLHSLHWFI
jgi:hypothetical protein